MRNQDNCSRAFTLVEVMLAVFLLALLTAAAALSFAEPIRRARARDALEQVRTFDTLSRQYARQFDVALEMVLEPGGETLWRRDARGGTQIGSRLTLPSGCRIDEVRLADRRYSDGQTVVFHCSASGLTRSYAVRLIGPGLDSWVLVSGLTGETTQVRDEQELDSLFRAVTAAGGAGRSAGRAGRASSGDDAD